MARSKSKHKHEYKLVAYQREQGRDRYELANRCSICGFERPADYRLHFIKDGSYFRLLVTKEEIAEAYPDTTFVDLL